jgi:hypothetical protein
VKKIANSEEREAVIKEILAEVANGFGRYCVGDYPGAKHDAVMQQLHSVIHYMEIHEDGVNLQPLRDHLHDLMDLSQGHRPEGLMPPVIPDRGRRKGQPPIKVKETEKRACGITLAQLYMDAGENEDAACYKAALLFNRVTGGQIKSWRKKAHMDAALSLATKMLLLRWHSKYPDAPGRAAEAMAKELRKFS